MAASSVSIRLPQFDQIGRQPVLRRRYCASPRKIHAVGKNVCKHAFALSLVDFNTRVNGTRVDFSTRAMKVGVDFSSEASEIGVDFSKKTATNGVDFPRGAAENGVDLSRRAAVVLLIASLVGSTLVDSAEARRIKPETIEKIREKLEKMKKASDRRNQAGKETSPLPPPTLKDLAGPLVEITL